MGETVAEIRIGGPNGSKTVRAVVDTGATNTVIDEGLAGELGIIATRADEVVLADGSVDKVGVGSAEVQIQGIKQVVPVYVYRRNLIGLTTLDATGLRVDPVTQTLGEGSGQTIASVKQKMPLIKLDKGVSCPLFQQERKGSSNIQHVSIPVHPSPDKSLSPTQSMAY